MLRQHLQQHRERILKSWRDGILAAYPEETRRFLTSEKDAFANPIGFALWRDTEALLAEFTAGLDVQRALPALDGIIRVRALQNCAPSQAVAFIGVLKQVLRDEVDALPQAATLRAEHRELEADLDALLLASFDIFLACRETVHRSAQKQLKSMVHVLIARANGSKVSSEEQSKNPGFALSEESGEAGPGRVGTPKNHAFLGREGACPPEMTGEGVGFCRTPEIEPA